MTDEQKDTATQEQPSNVFSHPALGTFIFRPGLLKPYDEMKIGIRKTQLLDGEKNVNQVDVLASNIAHMLSVLGLVIKESPDGFSLHDVDDYNDLFVLYMGYVNYERSFRRLARKKPEENGTGV